MEQSCMELKFVVSSSVTTELCFIESQSAVLTELIRKMTESWVTDSYLWSFIRHEFCIVKII